MSYIPTYEEVRLFIEAVKSVSSYDFSHYTIKSFTRRLEKVMSDYNFSNIKDLIRKVIKDKDFLEQVVKDITVNTTEFFRDPEIWIELRKLIPQKYLIYSQINIWHTGCSSGQEVYSMLFLLDMLGILNRAVVYGTDINEDMLELAKKGEFKAKDILDYKENFDLVFDTFDFKPKLEDFFDIDEKSQKYIVKEKYRSIPTYVKHDLVKDGNIFETEFHIIMCRNVLIYFDPQLQNQVYEMFYSALKDDGILVLGKHESILGELSLKFKKKNYIYLKKSENHKFW